MAVPPLVLLVSLLWLPETPSFLISVGKIQEAAKVMCWFEGSNFQEDLTDVIEQQEVKIRTSDSLSRRDTVRRYNSETFQPMLKRSSGLDSNSDRMKETSACKQLFLERGCRRALLSCCVIVAASAGCGAGAVSSFAAAVLRHSAHAVPRLNVTAYNHTIYNGSTPRALFDTSEAGSVLCGTALVLGAAVAIVSVDKLGRKMLLLWSGFGIAVCLALLGAYCDPRLRMLPWYHHRIWPYRKHIKDKEIANMTYDNDTYINHLHRIDTGNISLEVVDKIERNSTVHEETILPPTILMSVVLFLYNTGLGSVPFVLISELFAIQVRSFASSLLISWMWLSSFFLLRYYGSIAVSLGLHATYYICASITFLCSLYILLAIPETKGRTQQQIDKVLNGPLIVFKKKRKTNDER